MESQITCYLNCSYSGNIESNIHEFANNSFVSDVYIPGSNKCDSEVVALGSEKGFFSTDALKRLSSKLSTPYLLINTSIHSVKLGQNTLKRFLQIATDTQSSIVYSHFYDDKSTVIQSHPVIDYQEGSLRDDFDFGALLFIRSDFFKEVVADMDESFDHAGLYDLRLRLSRKDRVIAIPEFLYTVVEEDLRQSGEKMFDYVDPRNRTRQIEMEKACTNHLKAINGWLKPNFKSISFKSIDFPVEASVIIPVKNRIRTLKDAIDSVLKQKVSFPFNLIIVDNHSTDGTTELLQSYAKNDNRVIHIIPNRSDLGIGGCWNEAINHPLCGKFSIQLDSDDLYIDETVVEQIVSAFYEQKCAMVVGSYQMVDGNLNPIPPGLIDHKEWTPENGRNNALRINGLGAPRAFYTPVLRSIQVPNVSYGEDYAIGLAISRHYQIGRIYKALYLCRRWEDNSDAALDIEKMNKHNHYKDKIRTLELYARLLYVKRGQPV